MRCAVQDVPAVLRRGSAVVPVAVLALRVAGTSSSARCCPRTGPARRGSPRPPRSRGSGLTGRDGSPRRNGDLGCERGGGLGRYGDEWSRPAGGANATAATSAARTTASFLSIVVPPSSRPGRSGAPHGATMQQAPAQIAHRPGTGDHTASSARASSAVLGPPRRSSRIIPASWRQRLGLAAVTQGVREPRKHDGDLPAVTRLATCREGLR